MKKLLKKKNKYKLLSENIVFLAGIGSLMETKKPSDKWL